MPKLQRVVSFVGSLQRIRVVLAPLSVSDPVEYFLVNAVIGVVSSNLPLSLSLKYPSPPPSWKAYTVLSVSRFISQLSFNAPLRERK